MTIYRLLHTVAVPLMAVLILWCLMSVVHMSWSDVLTNVHTTLTA